MTVPASQYTLVEAMGYCLAMCQRAVAEVRALARVPGPQGERGPAGRDAGDLALLREYIDQRVSAVLEAATVTTRDGGRTMLWQVGGKEYAVKTALVLDAGVWKEGTAYSPGDGVSFGGSFFIAKLDTTAKPGTPDWRLAVRSGRDGKDHRPQENRQLEPVVRFK